MDIMIGHETTHAALDHGGTQPLTAEQRHDFDAACKAIRTNALDEMKTWSWKAIEQLATLREKAGPRLRPAYDTVIHALENDSFGRLPSNPKISGVASCYLQSPVRAVAYQATRQHTMDLFNKQLAHDETGIMIATLHDEWNSNLENYTVYQYLREAEYLPQNANNEKKGHPYDGLDELAGSTTNLMLKKPEAFGKNMAVLSPELQRALILVLDTTTGMLQTKYADNQELLTHIQQQRALFNAALN
ncbi:MAG: hypothetical protein AAB834_07545 [Patescibacteria group bacterium]